MKRLPNTNNPLVIRTESGNQQAWKSICTQIRAPVPAIDEPFYAYVEFLDEADFRKLTKEELVARVPDGYKHTFFFVVDAVAISHPEFPILVVDLDSDVQGRSFRAVPLQIQSIENNLSIGNMRFQEFADSVDRDGIFRGFPAP